MVVTEPLWQLGALLEERVVECLDFYSQEGEECSVIVTWGRGREGQLGTGARADSAHPRRVDALCGRHVLQVNPACPGCSRRTVQLPFGAARQPDSYMVAVRLSFGARRSGLAPDVTAHSNDGCAFYVSMVRLCRCVKPCCQKACCVRWCGRQPLQVILYITMRKVLLTQPGGQVACGGHHTLAVCQHDADKEDTEDRRRGYKGKMRAWLAPATRISADASERCARPASPAYTKCCTIFVDIM